MQDHGVGSQFFADEIEGVAHRCRSKGSHVSHDFGCSRRDTNATRSKTRRLCPASRTVFVELNELFEE
jgi:hypothetical protein